MGESKQTSMEEKKISSKSALVATLGIIACILLLVGCRPWHNTNYCHTLYDPNYNVDFRVLARKADSIIRSVTDQRIMRRSCYQIYDSAIKFQAVTELGVLYDIELSINMHVVNVTPFVVTDADMCRYRFSYN